MFEIFISESKYLQEKIDAVKKVENYFQNKMKEIETVIEEVHQNQIFFCKKIEFPYQMGHWIDKGLFVFNIYFGKEIPIYIKGTYDSKNGIIKELYFKSDQTYQGNWKRYFEEIYVFGYKKIEVTEQQLDKLKDYGDRMNKYLHKWMIEPKDDCSSLGCVNEKLKTVAEFKNKIKPKCYTYFKPMIENIPLQLFEDLRVFKAFYECIYMYEKVVDKVFLDIAENNFFQTA